MQNLELYSLRDVKVGNYGIPMFVVSKGMALRVIKDVVDDKRTPVGKYPQDFQLFYLGKFNDALGAFDLLNKPEFILTASDLVDDVQSTIKAVS